MSDLILHAGKSQCREQLGEKGALIYASSGAHSEAKKYFVPYWVDLCPRLSLCPELCPGSREKAARTVCASGQLKPGSTEAYESKMMDKFPGSTELVVATLPYWLFDGYYRKTVMKDFENKAFQKRSALRENDLVQRGWEREESDEINSFTYLKHKYFTLWDNAI